jgi:hypothetical protein
LLFIRPYRNIINSDKEVIGILLENINIFNGQFNLDLNKDIDLILKIVNDISEMHNNFTFSKKTEVLNDFKYWLFCRWAMES